MSAQRKALMGMTGGGPAVAGPPRPLGGPLATPGTPPRPLGGPLGGPVTKAQPQPAQGVTRGATPPAPMPAFNVGSYQTPNWANPNPANPNPVAQPKSAPAPVATPAAKPARTWTPQEYQAYRTAKLKAQLAAKKAKAAGPTVPVPTVPVAQ